MARKPEPLDQYQVMDILATKWIGEEDVHGFDTDGDVINCYMHKANAKAEKKIQAQAGDFKVKFHYGPPEKVDDLMRRGR